MYHSFQDQLKVIKQLATCKWLYMKVECLKLKTLFAVKIYILYCQTIGKALMVLVHTTIIPLKNLIHTGPSDTKGGLLCTLIILI